MNKGFVGQNLLMQWKRIVGTSVGWTDRPTDRQSKGLPATGRERLSQRSSIPHLRLRHRNDADGQELLHAMVKSLFLLLIAIEFTVDVKWLGAFG